MNNLAPFSPDDFDIRPAELSESSPRKFYLDKFLCVLRERWWLPLATLVLGTTLGLIHSALTPPTFISVASMWETEKVKLPETDAFVEDRQNYFGTQSQLLRSARVEERALNRLKASGTNVVPLDKYGQPLPIKVQVRPVPKSSIFEVEASGQDPIYTRKFLDALMNEYLDYKRHVRMEVSGDTLASISDQVLRLQNDLKADQEALIRFQETNNFDVLEQESASEGAYLARLKTQLADYQLESRLIDATALEMELAKPGAANTVGTMPDLAIGNGAGANPQANPGIQDTKKELELLVMERDLLSKNLRPKHPTMVKLDADIEHAKSLIAIYRQQNLEQIATSRQDLQIKISSVEASIKETEERVKVAGKLLAEAARLKANVTRNQTLYDQLVTLLQNVDIRRNIDQDTLAILEPATEAFYSSRKEHALILLGGVGGLGLGLGLVLLISMQDDRFSTLVEMVDKVSDKIIGQVPEIVSTADANPLALLENNDGRHEYAESYRNLRSALFFLDNKGLRPKVLLVTSAVPNEGKSTIAANLARTIALGGLKVLLVDGDMRKGHLHNLFHVQASPGLTEALSQPTQVNNFIQTNGFPNFSFLARGSETGNPGDLLLNSSFESLIERLRQQFDYILIDSCPVFAADDSTMMAPRVDGTLFVTRSDYSRAGLIREALAVLARRQANVLGLVLNRSNSRMSSYHYYKYQDYHLPPGKNGQ